ncbi:MAG: LacI family DNA-binding transcriptional regulator [Oscillibacter sp.]
MRMKRATIKDVAALAGVSFATVSRVLDDRPEISGETKVRVRAACAQLGYVANAAARGLTGRATHTIGLIVPDVSNPYFAGVATAIERTAAEQGYRVLLNNSHRDPERELSVLDALLSRQIDGIIISALSPESQERHSHLLGSVPCVYLGVNHGEDCSYVMVDNELGAYEATRYLLTLGHRDLVFLGGRRNSKTCALRTRGFHRALEEADLEGRALPAPAGPVQNRTWAYDTAVELLRAPTRPDAIFAFSDMVAMQVLEAAEACGVHIPDDLSLMGFDNVPFAALPRIDLTTVSQHELDLGRIATERLLARLGGAVGHTVDVLRPELILRSTCGKNKRKVTE